MIVLTEQEDLSLYDDFSTKVAVAAFKCTTDKIVELSDANVSVKDSTVELGMAGGQVVLDRVIELTKDMDRDTLVKFLAQSTSALVVKNMNQHPHYRMMVMLVSKLM
jgi:hypothetical protein